MYKYFVSIFPSNDKSYLQNSIFDPKKKWMDGVPMFIKLKKFLNQKNIDINTYDVPTKEASYRYVYFDLPYPWNLWSAPVWKLIFSNREKNILICNDPPFVIPFNYWKIFHYFFRKVYTWNEGLIDNEKIFKMRLPKSSAEINTQAKKFKEKKFLTLINANKLPFYPFQLLSSFGKELYSERIKAIEFFEKKIPDKFFLYGKGWNKPKKYNLKEQILGFKKYSTYRGEVTDKIKVLSVFKYCVCFENMTDVNGLISEKIFDCFKAKCVPIYWGASNIKKYIPKDCFIDFRNFGNFEKLLNFIVSINEDRYNRYIDNIEKLLADKKFRAFWFEDGFSKFFLEDVLEIKQG